MILDSAAMWHQISTSEIAWTSNKMDLLCENVIRFDLHLTAFLVQKLLLNSPCKLKFYFYGKKNPSILRCSEAVWFYDTFSTVLFGFPDGTFHVVFQEIAVACFCSYISWCLPIVSFLIRCDGIWRARILFFLVTPVCFCQS